MTLTFTLSLVLLVCFIVMIVIGIVGKEAATSRFWFQIIVGLAVLATIGNFQ